METIIKILLVDHLNLNNIISKNHHGFIAYRYSEAIAYQIFECLNYWIWAIDKGKYVDICYIDFKYAFDSVSNDKLIYRLKHIGISYCHVTWLSAFLSSRSRVLINYDFVK